MVLCLYRLCLLSHIQLKDEKNELILGRCKESMKDFVELTCSIDSSCEFPFVQLLASSIKCIVVAVMCWC